MCARDVGAYHEPHIASATNGSVQTKNERTQRTKEIITYLLNRERKKPSHRSVYLVLFGGNKQEALREVTLVLLGARLAVEMTGPLHCVTFLRV